MYVQKLQLLPAPPRFLAANAASGNQCNGPNKSLASASAGKLQPTQTPCSNFNPTIHTDNPQLGRCDSADDDVMADEVTAAGGTVVGLTALTR